MDDSYRDAAEKAFVPDEITQMAKEAVETTIQNNAYHHQKVGQWNSNIVEMCLKKLTSLNKPFKYIVTSIIMQKNGAGLHSANSCYWDNATDGTAFTSASNLEEADRMTLGQALQHTSMRLKPCML